VAASIANASTPTTGIGSLAHVSPALGIRGLRQEFHWRLRHTGDSEGPDSNDRRIGAGRKRRSHDQGQRHVSQQAGTRFDHAYYRDKHMPLIQA
jgi:hypothetical protein